MNKVFYLIMAIVIIAVISAFSHAIANEVESITACINPSGLIHVLQEGEECGANETAVELQTAATPPIPPEFFVDCASGEKIADVLAEVAYAKGPVTITISGVCQESVTITRDDVTLRGGTSSSGLTPDPSAWFIIHLNGARRIKIENLSLTGGGTGLNADSGATFEASGLYIKDASSGVHLASEASGSLSNSIIENCHRGIVAWGSGTLNVNGGEVKNSNSFGVQAVSKAFISLDGGFKVTGSTDQAVFAGGGGSIDIYNAIVEDNQSAGVWAMEGASLSIVGSNAHIRRNNDGVVAWASSVTIRDGVEITDNNYNGISVNFGSHLFLDNGVTLARNTHHGIIVGSSSTATVNDSFIQDNYNHGIEILAESLVFFGDGGNTIINNGQWGINCNQDPPSSSQIWGNPGTVSGNPSGQINCPGY